MPADDDGFPMNNRHTTAARWAVTVGTQRSWHVKSSVIRRWNVIHDSIWRVRCEPSLRQCQKVQPVIADDVVDNRGFGTSWTTVETANVYRWTVAGCRSVAMSIETFRARLKAFLFGHWLQPICCFLWIWAIQMALLLLLLYGRP